MKYEDELHDLGVYLEYIRKQIIELKEEEENYLKKIEEVIEKLRTI